MSKATNNTKAREAFDDFDYVSDAHGNKKVIPSQRNIGVALQRIGVKVSYDVFADQVMIEGLAGHGPMLDDAAVNAIRLKADRDFRLRVQKEFFFDVVDDMARQNSFHPVRDYLDDVQAKWDGQSRLDRFASRYLGVPDTDYTKGVIPIWMLAAVRRVRQPGCKFDEMLVLIGPQGVQKSTVFQVLAGQEEHFTDSLEIGAKPKEVIEETRGKWIAESADLHGYSKKDIDRLKAFMSRQRDTAREAYGRLSKTVPRAFILGGTSNNRKFLKDPTGHRRFWPVDVGTIDIASLRRDRDQLWGEAAALEARPGASIRLPRELWAAAAVVQEDHAEENSIAEILAHKVGVLYWGKLTSQDVYKLCKLDRPDAVYQSHREAIKQAMTKLGWESKSVSVGGIKSWGYKKNKNETAKFQTDGVIYDDVAREWEPNEPDREAETRNAALTLEQKIEAARAGGLG